MMSALRSLVRKCQVAMLPQDARSVLRDRLTYLSPEKISRLTRALDDVVDRQVSGDILEFGVALGGSSVLLARRVSPERQFHGFDAFGLISPPISRRRRKVEGAISSHLLRTIDRHRRRCLLRLPRRSL